eukprot:TRINITY_DN18538_c0_g1::TRINITY_DN18538_c0_g1_i1::g.1040::m.1040 TRINITY_DN18538_c0_g1::TRINITY_DN18538_c0_g1_i1::g.1040  ORF type:complete len:420 (-),score=121.24,sp/Q9ZQ18/REIL2_ARATH/30.51/1e-43,zf-C2H2_2/PF12756.2/6.3,zf-C2H2_2/PF12756.2/0.032,zf-C2H2_2/PF12756.2/2.5e-25,zf-C2H2_jaz/PF12171.3/0.19,zf-C2H2_jaz/PF12171.3/3.3e-05,zf-C2H2_jaz/PF12171.3/0.014,zf-C2H2_4/PF13894.1/3.1e+02,zf-C2H2_4/PF13894.1/0.058,zf-C2H2_4/PF13894.1/1.9e+02,zf-C2H2_4/PF13894.1/1.1,zf-met/PF12874.2/9.6e+02,zf-met/P
MATMMFPQSYAPESNMMLTCLGCRCEFATQDEQRNHYRSEWHRINLKRKIAQLPPLTEQEFQTRLAEVEDSQSLADDKPTPRKKGKSKGKDNVCEVCTKTFHSEKALVQHQKTRGHIAGEEEAGNAEGDAEGYVHDDDQDFEALMQERLRTSRQLDLEECVFCLNHKSATFEDNITHMAKHHGFIIPYVENVKNLATLLQYVGQKVAIGYTCVFCDRGFQSVDAVRKHMLDKGHCKMKFEPSGDDEDDEVEYEEFYEFGDDAGQWEEVDSDDNENTNRGLIVANDSAQTSVLVEAGYERQIETPEGATKYLGHRNMRIFYKQRPRPEDNRASTQTVHQLLLSYQEMGIVTRATGYQPFGKSKKEAMRVNRKCGIMQLRMALRNNVLHRRNTGCYGRNGGEPWNIQ